MLFVYTVMRWLVVNFPETFYSKGETYTSLFMDINFRCTFVYRFDAPIMALQDSKSLVRCSFTRMDGDNLLYWDLNLLRDICLHQVKWAWYKQWGQKACFTEACHDHVDIPYCQFIQDCWCLHCFHAKICWRTSRDWQHICANSKNTAELLGFHPTFVKTYRAILLPISSWKDEEYI